MAKLFSSSTLKYVEMVCMKNIRGGDAACYSNYVFNIRTVKHEVFLNYLIKLLENTSRILLQVEPPLGFFQKLSSVCHP